MAYTVKNNCDHPIWLKDGNWMSGEIDAFGQRKIDSDHDANVTIYPGGSWQPMGLAWIPQTGSIAVDGSWTWVIAPV